MTLLVAIGVGVLFFTAVLYAAHRLSIVGAMVLILLVAALL